MTTALKTVFGLILLATVGVAAWDYFLLNKPDTGATLYGFLRFCGPLITGVIALIIAIAGNKASDDRQEKARLQAIEDKRETEEEEIESAINGILMELEINLLKLHKLWRYFKKTPENEFPEVNEYRLVRPIFASVQALIVKFPKDVVVTIVEREPHVIAIFNELDDAIRDYVEKRPRGSGISDKGLIEKKDKIAKIAVDAIMIIASYAFQLHRELDEDVPFTSHIDVLRFHNIDDVLGGAQD